MKRFRGFAAAFAVVVAFVAVPSAQAAFPSVFKGEVTCATKTTNGNIRACSGKTLTFDGVTKIDVNVFLPPATGGTEGPYPVIGVYHGWGGSKLGLTNESVFQGADPRIQGWAEHGYAVFSMSDRGWGKSCGKFDPQRTQGVCTKGYNHLMDDRYEVRDAQFLIGELADEGIAEPKKIGATGASYGGGMSIALAALRNRTMEVDGSLVPWKSPEKNLEMEIAAAVPQWPWTDIGYALAPNGHNLDYVTDSTYKGPQGNFPIGVWKASWNEALNFAGEQLSNYNPTDPQADIPGWLLRLKAGEPYTDPTATSIFDELTAHHSSFSIDHSEPPAPLLIQSGWNDDLFPADEALRFYQRTRAQYPEDPISLFFMDDGHARSQNKPADVALFNQRLEAWLAHYLKGEGDTPSSSVETLTTTCPKTEPSEGPFSADDWSDLAPGEIRFQSAGPQMIEPRAGEENPNAAEVAFDPIVNPQPSPCNAVPATDEGGVANYRLPAAPEGGYTLMGSPTISATLEVPSPNSEVAARLLDVSPQGEERLIARTVYRPVGGSQEVVFQLHPQGYRFEEGHVAKLELLPSDAPYERFSNLQAPITVSNLELRLPVMEEPGELGGMVQAPAPKVVPAGYQLAAEFKSPLSGGGETGGGDENHGGNETPPSQSSPQPTKVGLAGLGAKLSANRSAVMVPLSCGGEGACSGQVSVSAKRPGGKGAAALAHGTYSIAQGGTATVRLPLTKAGRKLVTSALAGRHPMKTLSGMVVLNDAGRPTSLTSKRAVQLPRAY